MGGRGGGFELEANLNTFKDENRDGFCWRLLEAVAIVDVVDVDARASACESFPGLVSLEAPDVSFCCANSISADLTEVEPLRGMKCG